MRRIVAADLESRVFSLQDARAADLHPVRITALDPFLRNLLFTDGTVTRALEAHLLDRSSVEVIDQSPVRIEAEPATWLGVDRGEECVRRRVVINMGSPPSPTAYAESHIFAGRLPAGFIPTLSASSEGIGESLRRAHLESRRDLLWFGLGEAAEWAQLAGDAPVLVRLYRLIVAGQPAISIAESFVVELDSGIYRLCSEGARGELQATLIADEPS